MTLLDDVVTAVKAGDTVPRVYKLGEVPAPGPTGYPYAVVGLGAPDKISRTLDGQAGDTYRATLQVFGRDIDGVLDFVALGDLDGRFVNGRLMIREVSSAPFRDPDDDGVLAVTLTYRF